ncbi:MAG: AAA family ATPase, partial [Rhizomicrobium sp.]
MSGTEYGPPDARLRGKVRHTKLEPKRRTANGHDHHARERFKLVAINDIVLDDAPLWLVNGLIPTGPSFGVIFGKPKSGKTFFAADLFFHVAM